MNENIAAEYGKCMTSAEKEVPWKQSIGLSNMINVEYWTLSTTHNAYRNVGGCQMHEH